MPPANRSPFADFIGFLAYLFVVNGGRIDPNAVRGAASLLSRKPDTLPPPPLPADDFRPIEAPQKIDFEPLFVTGVWFPSSEPERTLTPAGAS